VSSTWSKEKINRE